MPEQGYSNYQCELGGHIAAECAGGKCNSEAGGNGEVSTGRQPQAVAKLLAMRGDQRKPLIELERAKGFEPSAQNSQPVQNQNSPETTSPAYTQIRAQILGELGPELTRVVANWASLSQPLKAAILAIANASNEARPATGLEACGNEVPRKSNFPVVPPSAMGNQLNPTENNQEKVNSL